MGKSCSVLLFIFVYSFSAISMEMKIDEKRTIVRVVVDKKLKTLAYYDDNSGVTKIIIRDPQSQVKEFYIFEWNDNAVKERIEKFLQEIPSDNYTPNILGLEAEFYIAQRTFGFDLFQIKFQNFPLEKTTIICFNMSNFYNKFLFPIRILSSTEHYYRENELAYISYNARMYFNKHSIFEKDKMYFDQVEGMDSYAKELESRGVKRDILFKYLPNNYFITPEIEMSNIVKKIVFDQDFSSIEFIKTKVQTYTSKQTGSKTLGEQMELGKFPLSSNILKHLMEKLKNVSNLTLEERKYIISAVLNSTDLFNGKYRSNIGINNGQETGDLQHFSFITKIAMNDFLSQEVESTQIDANELVENFFNKFNPTFQEYVKKFQIPVLFYAAQFILENPLNDPANLLSNSRRRKLIMNLLDLNKDIHDPLDVTIKIDQFANNYLVKLASYDVHHSFSSAKSAQEKCKVLEQYLKLANNADGTIFTQEFLDQNIGALALGEGLTFDFPILTNEYDTCLNLMLHLCNQKNQINKNDDDLELEIDSDCQILVEMAWLINQIAEQTILLDKIQDSN